MASRMCFHADSRGASTVFARTADFSIVKLYALTLDKRIRNIFRDVHPDAFRLQILADGVNPALPTDSRSLVAAKGRHVTNRPVGVDPNGSGLEPLGHQERAAHAVCPNARGQTVDRAVCDTHGFIFVVKRHD